MKNFILVLIGMIVMPALSAFSQVIVTDRPDVTESSSTIPKNSFQIESGMIYQKSGDLPNSPVNIYAPSTLFRFGILKLFELRLFSQYQNDITLSNSNFPTIVSGFNDIEVGTKIQLFKKESSKTEIAFVTHLLIPTGSDGVSNIEYASINKFAVSHGITDHFGLGYNLGYKYNWTGESSLLYSLSISYSINDKFGFYVEPYGDITEFTDYLVSIDGGIVYKIRDNFQADFSLGSGINHLMNFYAVGFGWNISRNYE